MDDLKDSDAVDFLNKVVFIAWYIWKARNDAIFNSTPLNPELSMNFWKLRCLLPVQLDNPIRVF